MSEKKVKDLLIYDVNLGDIDKTKIGDSFEVTINILTNRETNIKLECDYSDGFGNIIRVYEEDLLVFPLRNNIFTFDKVKSVEEFELETRLYEIKLLGLVIKLVDKTNTKHHKYEPRVWIDNTDTIIDMDTNIGNIGNIGRG